MKKIFILLASPDKVVHLEISLALSLNLLMKKKVEKLRLVIGGPVLKIIEEDEDFLENIRVVQEFGAKLYTCELATKRKESLEVAKETGMEIVDMVDLLTDMLEEGWEHFSF
ncbi:MAG: hypothetical protein KAR35_09685 [Candidatus Heimdallarchaeota archaeon]|nr:hypothetical protein [Candidatus Heimdallarchaeota archaeon]MCK5049628.1 hypothetical protein [Candidatus Heimdallarchaeota archaeon]